MLLVLITAGAAMMLNVIQRPEVDKHHLLATTKRNFLSIAAGEVCDCLHIRDSVTPTEAQYAIEETSPRVVDQTSFLKQLDLMLAQLSALDKQSETVDCNVIVMDDDDDDDRMLDYEDGLCGTTHRLRGDCEANGSATSRLLQPCSQLRRLLAIDIFSPLGSRTLQHVMTVMRNDSVPLNPYTVSHSLAGSDNALDYGMFCRTPIKGMFSGRLRQREFPIRYRPTSTGTHYHHYCFGRADRRKFCRRFDRGLSFRSYRLYQKCVGCTVSMDRLTAKEIKDWRSSRRLCDYVMRLQEKDRVAAAATDLSHTGSTTTNDAEVINISSDSDDEVPVPVWRKETLVAKKNDLMFRCHQCDIKVPCSSTSHWLIREHYRTCHGIGDINLAHVTLPDGSTAIQVVHVRKRSVTGASNSSVDPSAVLRPPHLQLHTSNQSVCGKETPRPSNTVVVADSRAHNFTSSQSPANRAISPCEAISGNSQLLPLARPLLCRNTSLLNGSVLCRGDNAASAQSVCDADVVCLD